MANSTTAAGGMANSKTAAGGDGEIDNSGNGALETITFGDKQAATMKSDMTEADLSSKELGASGAIIVAAFLPKCR